MFFTGVFINDTTGSAGIVIIEKVLKTAKRLYIVRDIRKLPEVTSYKNIGNQLDEIYNNPIFIRKKKVFSQSKRPPKTTRTPSVFVVAYKSNTVEKLTEIRNNKLPVEGILFQDNKKWHKEAFSPLRYGNNYYVNINDINDAMTSVLSTDRITITENLNFSAELESGFKDLLDKEHSNSDIVTALRLPIWFCERVKQIKRY